MTEEHQQCWVPMISQWYVLLTGYVLQNIPEVFGAPLSRAAMVPAHVSKNAHTSCIIRSCQSRDFLPTGGVWEARDWVDDVEVVGSLKWVSTDTLSRNDRIHWVAQGWRLCYWPNIICDKPTILYWTLISHIKKNVTQGDTFCLKCSLLLLFEALSPSHLSLWAWQHINGKYTKICLEWT